MKLQRRHDDGASKVGLAVFALFVLAVALLGGSSRYDAVQIVALRSIAALFLIPVIYLLHRGQFTSIRAPLTFLGLFALWMLIQIVPLPPAIWQSLPGSEAIVTIGAAAGLQDTWRPISLVPFRTYGALASLVVPIVALMLPLSLRVKRRQLLWAVVAIGAVCAFLGVLQILDGRNSPFYLYEFVNRGSPTGLLANRNHTAVLMAMALVTISYLLTSQPKKALPAPAKIALGGGFLLILIVTLISGSRGGFLTAMIALLASTAMFYQHLGASGALPKSSKQSFSKRPLIIVCAAIFVMCILASGLALSGRLTVLERLFAAEGPWDDLRWSILPILWQMIKTHGLVGIGVGSFEEAYHMYEPTALLLPAYVNMAHNDGAQFFIEAGVPGVLIVLGFLVWAGRGLKALLGNSQDQLRKVLYWGALLSIVVVASLADYPLRAPLFQVVCVWLIVVFCIERQALSRR